MLRLELSRNWKVSLACGVQVLGVLIGQGGKGKVVLAKRISRAHHAIS